MHPGGAGGPGGSGAAKEKRSLGKAMKGGIFKGKGPAQMQRQEDEVRGRMSIASEVFRKAVLESQAVRQEYFGLQLPKILRVGLAAQGISVVALGADTGCERVATERVRGRDRSRDAIPPGTICLLV